MEDNKYIINGERKTETETINWLLEQIYRLQAKEEDTYTNMEEESKIYKMNFLRNVIGIFDNPFTEKDLLDIFKELENGEPYIITGCFKFTKKDKVYNAEFIQNIKFKREEDT